MASVCEKWRNLNPHDISWEALKNVQRMKRKGWNYVDGILTKMIQKTASATKFINAMATSIQQCPTEEGFSNFGIPFFLSKCTDTLYN